MSESDLVLTEVDLAGTSYLGQECTSIANHGRQEFECSGN